MLNMRPSELLPHADSTGKVFLETVSRHGSSPGKADRACESATRFPVRLAIGTGGVC
jgi:hypothetical protein